MPSTPPNASISYTKLFCGYQLKSQENIRLKGKRPAPRPLRSTAPSVIGSHMERSPDTRPSRDKTTWHLPFSAHPQASGWRAPGTVTGDQASEHPSCPAPHPRRPHLNSRTKKPDATQTPSSLLRPCTRQDPSRTARAPQSPGRLPCHPGRRAGAPEPGPRSAAGCVDTPMPTSRVKSLPARRMHTEVAVHPRVCLPASPELPPTEREQAGRQLSPPPAGPAPAPTHHRSGQWACEGPRGQEP